MSTGTKGTLRLVFLTSDGSKETLTINNAKTTLTTDAIRTAMDTIRTSDAIRSRNNKSLSSNFSAKLTSSSTTDYSVI